MSASTAVLVAALVRVLCPVKASDVACSAKEINPVPTAVSRTSWGTAKVESNHVDCQRNSGFDDTADDVDDEVHDCFEDAFCEAP